MIEPSAPPQLAARYQCHARRFDAHHPAVQSAARRAGMDVETYLALKETEGLWPRSRIAGA